MAEAAALEAAARGDALQEAAAAASAHRRTDGPRGKRQRQSGMTISHQELIASVKLGN